jgi:hypothetical protein
LSARRGSETEGAGDSRRSKKSRPSERSGGGGGRGGARGGGQKSRSGDIGRALRSAYDDTLREAVPDDFLKLIGKLT